MLLAWKIKAVNFWALQCEQFALLVLFTCSGLQPRNSAKINSQIEPHNNISWTTVVFCYQLRGPRLKSCWANFVLLLPARSVFNCFDGRLVEQKKSYVAPVAVTLRGVCKSTTWGGGGVRFAIRAQRINLGCCLPQLASLHKPYGGCLLSCWRMQPPTTAATITVHLFFCAASCLSVSQLSAKPLRAEEHTEKSCQAATQTNVYAALSRRDAIRLLTYLRAAIGLHCALCLQRRLMSALRGSC